MTGFFDLAYSISLSYSRQNSYARKHLFTSTFYAHSLKHVKNILIRYHLHQIYVIYIISSSRIPVEYMQDLLPISFALNHLVVIQKQPFRGILILKSAISIKLQSSFIEITLQHGCSTVNLLHVFITPLHKNISRGLRLMIIVFK